MQKIQLEMLIKCLILLVFEFPIKRLWQKVFLSKAIVEKGLGALQFFLGRAK